MTVFSSKKDGLYDALPSGWTKIISTLSGNDSSFPNVKFYASDKKINTDNDFSFLVNNKFSGGSLDDHVVEANNYLNLTLRKGYYDVIYPQWGDTALDVFQIVNALPSQIEDVLPRRNAWPMRGSYTSDVKNECQALAALNCNVLILGPTGCGKEAIARLIHKASMCTGKFIPVSVPSIPPHLFDGLVHGIEKGVATGVSHASGLFQEAEKGTLFLDEVADMDLQNQASLLRALSERYSAPVGGNFEETGYNITCRIVAATNQIERICDSTTFRPDFRARLAEQQIDTASEPEDWRPIKPLALVREQIPLLFAMQLVRTIHEQIGGGLMVKQFWVSQLKDEKPSKNTFNKSLRDLSQKTWQTNYRQLQEITLHAVLRALRGMDPIKQIIPPEERLSYIRKVLEKGSLDVRLKLDSMRIDSKSFSPSLTKKQLEQLIKTGGDEGWNYIKEWSRRQVVDHYLKLGYSRREIAKELKVSASVITRFLNK